MQYLTEEEWQSCWPGRDLTPEERACGDQADALWAACKLFGGLILLGGLVGLLVQAVQRG